MLNSLRIQNFKSWKDTGTIEFGSLTGFFGTNSSGKTSILQFLLMLKQTVESSDRARILHLGDEKSYVDLGTLYDILHHHQDPSKLEFEFEWVDSAESFEFGDSLKDLLSTYSSTSPPYKFSAIVSADHDKITLDKFSYSHFNSEYNFNIIDKGHFPTPYYSLLLTNSLSKNEKIVEGAFRNPANFFGIPNGVYLNHPLIEDELQRIEESFYYFFESIHYLGPLREYPKRLYSWAGDKPQGVGDRGEDTIAALLSSRQNGPSVIQDNQHKYTVEQHVAHWLKELGLIHSFEVRPIAPNRKEYEVRIKRTAESAEVFLTDVGFGVSQLLPVLVLLFYVPEGSTIILEQPEIHLHPAVQAGLADVFIDAIKRRNVQIILESHSEHLLQRLQRRLAEEALPTEQVKLYFTDFVGAASTLTPLDLDEYGNIRNWPTNFFGDSFADASAMMDAELKRREAAGEK